MSVSIWPADRIEPSVLVTATPICCMNCAAFFDGVASLRKMFFKAVPATEPCNPTSPSKPVIAAVCSSVAPYVFAIGAATLNVSDILSRSTFDRRLTSLKTSVTRCALSASMPNCRIVFAITSAENARSKPDALASASTSSVELMISLTLKPARPSKLIASAACTLVNSVVEPSFLASASRFSKSFETLPPTIVRVSAPTLLIDF